MTALEARRAAFAALLECYHNSFAEVKGGPVTHSHEFIRQVVEAGKQEALTTDPRLTSTNEGAVAVGIAKQIQTNEVCARAFVDIEIGEAAYIVTFDKRAKPEQVTECLRGMGAVAHLCRPGDRLADGIVSDIHIVAVEPVQMVAESFVHLIKAKPVEEGSLEKMKLSNVASHARTYGYHEVMAKRYEAAGNKDRAEDAKEAMEIAHGKYKTQGAGTRWASDITKHPAYKEGAALAAKSNLDEAHVGPIDKAVWAKAEAEAVKSYGASTRDDNPDKFYGTTMKIYKNMVGVKESAVDEAEGKFTKHAEFITKDGKHAFRAGRNTEYRTWDDRHYEKDANGQWKHVKDHGYDGHESKEDAIAAAKANAAHYDTHMATNESHQSQFRCEVNHDINNHHRNHVRTVTADSANQAAHWASEQSYNEHKVYPTSVKVGNVTKNAEQLGAYRDGYAVGSDRSGMREETPRLYNNHRDDWHLGWNEGRDAKDADSDRNAHSYLWSESEISDDSMVIEEEALDASKVTVHTDLDHPRVHTLFSLAKKHGAKVVHSDMDGKVKLHFPTPEHGKAFHREADATHGHMASIKLGERTVSKPISLTGSRVAWSLPNYVPDVMAGKVPAIDPKKLSYAAKKHGAELRISASGDHEAIFRGYTKLKNGKIQQFISDAGIKDEHRPKVGWIGEGVNEAKLSFHNVIISTLHAAGMDGSKLFAAPAEGWNALHAALDKHGLMLSDHDGMIHDAGEHYVGVHQLAHKPVAANEPPRLIDGAFLSVQRTSGVGDREGADQNDMPQRGRHEFNVYTTGKKMPNPASAESSVPLKESFAALYTYAYGSKVDESNQRGILKHLLSKFKRSNVQAETGNATFDSTFKAIMARQAKNRVLVEADIDDLSVALAENFGGVIEGVAKLTLLDNGYDINESAAAGIAASAEKEPAVYAESLRAIARVMCLEHGYATDANIVKAYDELQTV